MPQWLVDTVGEGVAPLLWVAIAALIVIVLAVLIMLLARKALGGSIGGSPRNRAPRLAVMDVANIDQKRRLVLIRRDEVEHLVLVGGQNDLVVESSILRVPTSARGRNDSVPRDLEESEPADASILDRIMMARPGKAAGSPPRADAASSQVSPPGAPAARAPERQPSEARGNTPVETRSASPGAAARVATHPAPDPERLASGPRQGSGQAAPTQPQPRAPAPAAAPSPRPQPIRQAPPVSPSEPMRRPLAQVPPRSLATPTVNTPSAVAPDQQATKAVLPENREQRGQTRSEPAASNAPPAQRADASRLSPGNMRDAEKAPQPPPRSPVASPPAAAVVGGASALPRDADQGARDAAAPAVAEVASVRSFASMIQSRQGRNEPPPARSAPVPLAGTVATTHPSGPAPTKAPDVADEGDQRVEPDLDELLSAEFVNHFSGKEPERPGTPPAPPQPLRAQPPSSGSLQPSGDRVLTLEEEMERLLGDFTRDISDRNAS